jgi:hypothetical protein
MHLPEPLPHTCEPTLSEYHIHMTALISSHNLTSNGAENGTYYLQLLADGISKRLIKKS